MQDLLRNRTPIDAPCFSWCIVARAEVLSDIFLILLGKCHYPIARILAKHDLHLCFPREVHCTAE